MDRFLGTIALRKNQFQLLGAAAIFLASKMIEPTPISATTLVRCTADTYDREELLVSNMLKIKQYNLLFYDSIHINILTPYAITMNIWIITM